MLSDGLSKTLARYNIHYGWVVAGSTFLVMLATAGAMGSAGVLIQPFVLVFGWTTEQISSALAIRLVFFGLLGPFAAAFMIHFGLRKVVTTALVLIGAGVGLSMLMRELWQMMVLWGIVIGVGTGMTALVLGATVASRWFDKRRGRVGGLMTASNATGQRIFLPLLAALSENIGWRAALTLVVSMLGVAFVLATLFLRDYPAEVNLPVYGQTKPTPPPARSKQLIELLTTPLLTLREAAKTRVFWVLFATFYVCGFSTNGLLQQHWISICGDVGITPPGAAGYLALIGAFDFVGTILSGWLSDRYDNRYLLLAFYGLRGMSLIFLPYSGFSLLTLTAFAVFYGLDWVATVPPTIKLTAQRFGAEKAKQNNGKENTNHQHNTTSAAFFAGAVRTGTESY